MSTDTEDTGQADRFAGKEADVSAGSAPRQKPLRLSIDPTYDTRQTGPRFEVETWCNGRLSSRQQIPDPFIRTTVKIGWRDMLSALFRFTRASVEVRVNADQQIIEDVMELDANYIGHGSTRRAEWNARIERALEEHSER